MSKNKIKAAEGCRYKPSREELWTISCLAVQMRDGIFIDVYRFINSHKDCPAPAIIETLKAVAKYKPREPWAYAAKVLDIERGKFYAEKNIEEHARIKKEESQGIKKFGDVLKEIVGKI